MTPNPQTGLVDVVDQGTKTHTHHKMWPVDWAETARKGQVIKNAAGNEVPRFVLEEHYTPPEPAPVAPAK